MSDMLASDPTLAPPFELAFGDALQVPIEAFTRRSHWQAIGNLACSVALLHVFPKGFTWRSRTPSQHERGVQGIAYGSIHVSVAALLSSSTEPLQETQHAMIPYTELRILSDTPLDSESPRAGVLGPIKHHAPT